MFYVNYQTETSLTALADKADSIISFNDNICQIQANTPTFQRKQLKETNDQHYCFFHKRFGNKAIECVQLCNYNQGN